MIVKKRGRVVGVILILLILIIIVFALPPDDPSPVLVSTNATNSAVYDLNGTATF